jgi:hypothetical protein
VTRIVVAPGGTIQSVWGNQTHDQGAISFATAAQRTSDWPAPQDGALSWLADSHTPWVYRGGGWKALPLGMLGAAIGPGTSIDVTTAQTVVQVVASVVAGRRYRIFGVASGSQVTATGPIVYFHLLDGDGGVVRFTQATNLASGSALVGAGSMLWTAATTKSATVALQAVASAGALRITANQARIELEDIGG